MPLVNAKSLLQNLFEDENSRPSLRWLRDRQRDRSIPYVKCGRMVFFDLEAVNRALEQRQTVRAKVGKAQQKPHVLGI